MKKEVLTIKQASVWKTAGEIMKSGITEVPMLWGKYFPQEGVVILCGGSDCGKTTLAKQLAIAVARKDKELLGFGLNVKHGRALAVLTEDGDASVSVSMYKQLKGVNDEQVMENIRFATESKDVIKELREALEVDPVDFIIIDTLMDFFRGNPNDQAHVRQNIAPFNALAKEYNTCICFVHHTTKNSDKYAPDKSRVNGSTAFEAKVRCTLELRYGAESGTRLLTILKNNYEKEAEKNGSVKLNFDEDTLTFSNTGETVPIGGGIAITKKYDRTIWVPKFQELTATGLSQVKAYEQIRLEFPNSPGLSWFQTNTA